MDSSEIDSKEKYEVRNPHTASAVMFDEYKDAARYAKDWDIPEKNIRTAKVWYEKY